MFNNGTSRTEKLDALRKREAALKAAIAAEQVKQQKAKEKLQAREFFAVGEALCMYAAQAPEFHSTLKAMLGAAVAAIDEPTKRFLCSRGWGL
jgi:hypothetical protein